MTYFANHVGGAQRPLQGFDATCDGVLTAEPRFELFYLGTRANPTMAKFEALPGTKRWARDYKWLRPQYYKRSPFRTTLNMDGDAVPCGARLVEAFRAFAESKAAVAGLWHVGASYSGLNTGFMAWDRDKAKSLLAAWADGMRSAILANHTIRHDQPSLAAALNTTRGVSVLRFSEENVCRVCRLELQRLHRCGLLLESRFQSSGLVFEFVPLRLELLRGRLRDGHEEDHAAEDEREKERAKHEQRHEQLVASCGDAGLQGVFCRWGADRNPTHCAHGPRAERLSVRDVPVERGRDCRDARLE